SPMRVSRYGLCIGSVVMVWSLEVTALGGVALLLVGGEQGADFGECLVRADGAAEHLVDGGVDPGGDRADEFGPAAGFVEPPVGGFPVEGGQLSHRCHRPSAV